MARPRAGVVKRVGHGAPTIRRVDDDGERPTAVHAAGRPRCPSVTAGWRSTVAWRASPGLSRRPWTPRLARGAHGPPARRTRGTTESRSREGSATARERFAGLTTMANAQPPFMPRVAPGARASRRAGDPPSPGEPHLGPADARGLLDWREGPMAHPRDARAARPRTGEPDPNRPPAAPRACSTYDASSTWTARIPPGACGSGSITTIPNSEET